jgi:hypothetical protein
VGLSVAALVFFAIGMLMSWSRVAVLIVPVVLGVVALVLAIRARGSAAGRPGRVIAFVLSALTIITPAVTMGAVLLAGALAPSAVYTLTVDSPEPVNVVIRKAPTARAWSGTRETPSLSTRTRRSSGSE